MLHNWQSNVDKQQEMFGPVSCSKAFVKIISSQGMNTLKTHANNIRSHSGSPG